MQPNVNIDRFAYSLLIVEAVQGEAKSTKTLGLLGKIGNGGEGGIRTPGGVTHARFPGVCLKPLSHLSNRLTAATYAALEIDKLTR